MPVSLDFAREWLSFFDPADPEHEFRCDLTWLMSTWGCIFARGCHGVVEGRAADGCCSHGAFFSDKDDQKRVRAHAKELSKEDWQLRKVGKREGITEVEDGRTRTRTHDGACVFLNRPGFEGGMGCALHAYALRVGLHPLETKPDVCWQLPVQRSSEWVDRLDETRILVTTITEFDRRGWGEGGHDLHWWCTESSEAHGQGDPLYISYGPELEAIMGKAGYAELKRQCDLRRANGGLHAVHPAEQPGRAVGPRPT